MTKNIEEIRETLVGILEEHKAVLRVTSDTFEKYEVTGTVEAMQGKKKVEGFYFASVVPKPKDVRFYFFPAYTHMQKLGELSDNLKKALKGKSCFHIKYMDEDLKSDLEDLVDRSVILYKADGLLRK
jgi:hypothetical protein